MESPARPGLTRRAFFAALLAPFLARLAKWLPRPAVAAPPAPTSPTTIALDGQLLRIGDSFTIQGYYAAHPVTGRSTGKLKEFVVAAVDERRRSISFVPAAITSGQYQNVHKAA